MRITIAAVGRMKAGPLQALGDDYAKRLARGPFGRPVVKEVEQRGRLSTDELTEREASLLEAALPPGARVIALDERGDSLTSRDLAALLASLRDGGVAELAFVIGGADGLAERLRKRAERQIAFGNLTWPHLLVRVMLLEQLYRAQAILSGHPYHRD